MISPKGHFGEAGGSSDMIKLAASRTSDEKVIILFPYSRCVCVSDVSDVACVTVSVMLNVMVLHVFILCPCAVIVSLSHDVPIHAFPLPDALPRPVSLNQPTSFQPTSLPVQPLPKRGAFQRSPPGVPRVQAGSGIHLLP